MTTEEIKTQEEVQANPQDAAPMAEGPSQTIGEPPEETVGDVLQKASGEGWKWLVIVASAAVYLTAIVYAEVHGLTMLQKGVAPDMRFWAGAGMVAAGVSAILFPIALKTWTIEAKHRIAATLFYVADFAFLAFNAFTDFNTNAGGTLAPWAQTYVTYILPASPVIVGAMWAILWELDPAVKDKVFRLSLRMAMKQVLTRKVSEAAKGAQVSAAVNAAAQREVDRALYELFGARPADGYYVMDAPDTQRRTLLQSFFDGLSSTIRRVLSVSTPTQSQPSELPNEPKP